MTATVAGTIVTAGAGAVTIGGGWSVSTERAGAVTATGFLTVNTAGAGSVTATGDVGWVSTAGAGSVTATGGGARVLSPTRAGFVTATGVTCSEVLNTTGAALHVAGGVNSTTSDTGAGGVKSTTGDTGASGDNITTGMSSAKGGGEGYAEVPWKVVAVDLLANCAATTAPLLNRLLGVVTHGDKLAALSVAAGEMHARSTTGRTILYALVAMAVLLISVAVQCSNSMLNK
jgi:hypothetical protein